MGPAEWCGFTFTRRFCRSICRFVYPQWKIEAGNPLWWMPLLAALAVTAVLWRYRESWGRPLLFAWGFFCVALLPVLGFTDVGFMKFTLVADRYQHIAIIGVIALASAGLGTWQRRARGRSAPGGDSVAIVIVGALAISGIAAKRTLP